MRGITQLGNPVLRKKAVLVRGLPTKNLRDLIDSMIKTMWRAKGVGIAAPQIGKSLRLFIVASRPNPRYPNAPKMKPLAMINPQLIKYSQKMVTGWEGCLSIPGIRGQVPRYDWIQIQYTTWDGKVVRTRLAGFVARIFQHEFDHINGRVFLDRVNDTRTLVTEQEYRKILNNKTG